MSSSNPTTSPPENDGAAPSLDGMARICKALGHPVRMQIVAFLKGEKHCCCGQIVSRLPLAQSTVSQHLKYLKEAGIITGEIDGPGTAYCLNRRLLQQFRHSIGRFIDE